MSDNEPSTQAGDSRETNPSMKLLSELHQMSSTFMTTRRHHDAQSSNTPEFSAPMHSSDSQLHRTRISNELPRIPSHQLNVQIPDAHSPAYWSTSSNYLGEYSHSSSSPSSAGRTDPPSILNNNILPNNIAQHSSSELNRIQHDHGISKGSSNSSTKPPNQNGAPHSQPTPTPVLSGANVDNTEPSTANSTSYNSGADSPQPAGVGKTEVDRLMLAVQAQTGEPGSHSASKSPENTHPKISSPSSKHSSEAGHDSANSSHFGENEENPTNNEPYSATSSTQQADSANDGTSDDGLNGKSSNNAHSRDNSWGSSVGSKIGNDRAGHHPSSPKSAVGSRSSNAGVTKHSDYSFYCTFPGCTKRFKQRAHMHTHLRSHTGERPFECPYESCRKTFSQRCNLHTHIRSHTGERPYKCEVCGKAFSQQGNMRHHILIHYNENPLVCKIENCEKTFNQLGNLKAHQNTAHRHALQAFTVKLQSGVKVDDLPEEEKEMFEYFCSLYKNSNRGIKGRGKGTKTIVFKPQSVGRTRSQSSVDNTMDSFVPELLWQRTQQLPQDVAAKDQFGQGQFTPEQIQQYQADTQQFYPENQRLQTMHHQQQHQHQHLVQHQPGFGQPGLNQLGQQPPVQHQTQLPASHQQGQLPVLFSQVDVNHSYMQQPTTYANYNGGQQFPQMPRSQIVQHSSNQYEPTGEVGMVSQPQPQQAQQLSYPMSVQQLQQPVQYPLYYSQAMPVTDNQEALPSIMSLPKEDQQ